MAYPCCFRHDGQICVFDMVWASRRLYPPHQYPVLLAASRRANKSAVFTMLACDVATNSVFPISKLTVSCKFNSQYGRIRVFSSVHNLTCSGESFTVFIVGVENYYLRMPGWMVCMATPIKNRM